MKLRFPFFLAVVSLIAVIAVACGSASEPAAEESESLPAAQVAGGEETAAPASTASVASTAPLFTLPSATGDTFDLASFAGDKNVVLVFYRGFW